VPVAAKSSSETSTAARGASDYGDMFK